MSAKYLAAAILLCLATNAPARQLPLDRIELPAGFHIELYADNVPDARSLRLGAHGTVFVGTREAGRVYALTDADGDQQAERVRIIASGLRSPNGLAFHNGDLYVAERSRILAFDDIENHLNDPSQPQVLRDDLPTAAHHGWRYLGISPAGELYVSIGAPCNICLRKGYAVIERMHLDGSDKTIYARGIRNSVGFDWDPASGELWFTDNGVDGLGDDRPPDELNQATRAGEHFGFPFCHGGTLLDPGFADGPTCNEFTPPALRLAAHVAALGMRFYTGTMFPERYRGQIFIAEHGSWNRTQKIGYRVELVRLNAARQVVDQQPFASGWLQGEHDWGRPVDVLVMPDGALLVSDDKAGAVYRIYYTGGAR